ncbi:MAG: pyridoxamine 5'-phosphate oxidase [Chloroflexi bacterium]|nr:pyridoxamine 5'-phosphate oxidase [Chloroflexota bacterium]
MDADTLAALARLIRAQRAAALGTVRDGLPFVSMVVYAFEPDFSAFWLHLSRLALHTQAILADPRIGLMIAEADDGAKDAQTLARVSIQSEAIVLTQTPPEYSAAKMLYLARFPEAQTMFALGDFDLYRIEPRSARFVAGFARAYNLTAGNFREAAKAE